MPYFSIVIPLYNKEKFISDTLKSVLLQTFVDYEIIIINDASTDKSEEKVLQFKDPRIQIFNIKNGGVSSARNFGIDKAKSKYIAFLDADDYWYPDYLKEMYNNINAFPKIKAFTVAIEMETSKRILQSEYSIEKTADHEIVNYFKASRKRTVLSSSSSVFHKSIFKKTGVFDTKLKSGEDTDLWIRVGLIYPILFSWKVLARYVLDEKSLSKNYKTSLQSIDFSKYALLEKTNPDLKKFLDLNRFSLAIKAKLLQDENSYRKFYRNIDLSNLSFKKRFLLTLPSILLKPLIALKTVLANVGLGNSVFK
ncbi:glycosyltransferase family 2 protein [Flavobacterium agrisoli]|uniref:Glycosyltransferase family 2 protein n=1 Tax=Flavobacterium agrisoli TaxID=2793066 RepID=A0A934PL48_9FLAO|nr:glycosyltransferase family 2 protein [Flavobacterium agrisoli]MBK0368750.1 glycosyltransferase family 2 protein [Flavobacterium agrisoli]